MTRQRESYLFADSVVRSGGKQLLSTCKVKYFTVTLVSRKLGVFVKPAIQKKAANLASRPCS